MTYSIHDGRTIHHHDIIEMEGYILEPPVSDIGRCRFYFNRADGLAYYSEDGGEYKPFGAADTATSAQYLLVTRILAEDVSALKLVTATSGTHVELAQKSDGSKSRVLGMALSSGVIDDVIPILLFGNHTHASHTFTLNDPVFLGVDGAISATPPAAGWITTIGSSNGTGSIFLNIDEPIEIT